MSAPERNRDRDQLRDQARDILNFDPREDLPCQQVLGIGLTEDICQNDESLHRWLVCQSVEVAVSRGLEIRPAVEAAFRQAEEQCEFFDLELPDDRRTDFGPLQAEEQRETEQAELFEREFEAEAETRIDAPAFVDTRQQRPATEQEALVEETPGEGEARLSEFVRDNGDDDDGDDGDDGNGNGDGDRDGTRTIADVVIRTTSLGSPRTSVEFREEARPIRRLPAGQKNDLRGEAVDIIEEEYLPPASDQVGSQVGTVVWEGTEIAEVNITGMEELGEPDPEPSEAFEEGARFADLRRDDLQRRLNAKLREDARSIVETDVDLEIRNTAAEMTRDIERLVDAGIIDERQQRTLDRQLQSLSGVSSEQNRRRFAASLDRFLGEPDEEPDSGNG